MTFTELACASIGPSVAEVFAARNGGLWLEIELPGGEHPHQFLDLGEPSLVANVRSMAKAARHLLRMRGQPSPEETVRTIGSFDFAADRALVAHGAFDRRGFPMGIAFTHMARDAGTVVELEQSAFGIPRSVTVHIGYLAPFLELLSGALQHARAPECRGS